MHVAGSELCRQTIAVAVEQQQRVVTDRLEVSIVGAAFLLTVDRALGRVYVENDTLGVIRGFRLADQLPVHRHQPKQVLFARQQFRLKAIERRSQRRPMLPDLLGTDQAEGWVNGESLSVIEVFVACQTAVGRLPQQIG